MGYGLWLWLWFLHRKIRLTQLWVELSWVVAITFITVNSHRVAVLPGIVQKSVEVASVRPAVIKLDLSPLYKPSIRPVFCQCGCEVPIKALVRAVTKSSASKLVNISFFSIIHSRIIKNSSAAFSFLVADFHGDIVIRVSMVGSSSFSLELRNAGI